MVSLEQIKVLEQKVEHALRKMDALQSTNKSLLSENEDLKAELELMKEHCARLEQDEEKIEQGILSVLDKLNNVEADVRQAQETTSYNNVEVNSTPQQSDEPSPNENAETYHEEPEVSEFEQEQHNQEVQQEQYTQEVQQEINHSDNVNDEARGMLNHAEQASQLDIF